MVVWAQAANGGQDDNPALFKVERGPGRYHAGAGVDVTPDAAQDVVAPATVPGMQEPAEDADAGVPQLLQRPTHEGTAGPSQPGRGGSVESLIRARFGAQAEAAIEVAWCESTMNPSAVSYDGSSFGLFQIHAPTWAPMFTGFWEHWMEAEWNIEHAWIIFERAGYSFTPWACW